MSEGRNYPFNTIYKLNNIIRYSNVSRISSENVAVHMYHVAAIVLQLFTEYEFNLEKALVMALSHDIPETEIDDISHATKMKNPAIAKALKDAESELIKQYPKFMMEAIEEFEIGSTLEAVIVQIADADQCSQYSWHEIHNLGNTSSEMENIYEHSVKRVNVLKDKIKSHKRLNCE